MIGFLKSGTNALLGLDISSTTIKLLELSKSGPDSKYHPLGSGNTQSVTVIEAGDRTRVIVAMTELVAYNAYVEGNTLYVLVGKEDVAGFVEESPDAIVAESEAEEEMVDAEEQIGVTSVTDIDFRRGEQGEGRVIVTLSDPGIGVDISSEGGKIMVEFSNTQLPRALQRRLDVTDFATPVLIVDALPEAGNTILTIDQPVTMTIWHTRRTMCLPLKSSQCLPMSWRAQEIWLSDSPEKSCPSISRISKLEPFCS